MLLRVRHLRRRRRPSGAVYWWWEHPIHGCRPVPQDPQRAAIEAERLNGLVRSGRMPPKAADDGAHGTMAWCLSEYRASDRYKALAPGSKWQYERWLTKFREMWGGLPAAAITRKAVRRLDKALSDKPGERRMALAVLSAVLELAREEELIQANPCHRMRLPKAKRRQRCPSRDEIAALLRAARRSARGRETVVWLRLLYYTGQRPSDVIALTWSAWDGAVLRLRQKKTKKLLWVPAHRSLRLMLRQLKAKTAITRIVPAVGTDRASYRRFNDDFRSACKAAGIQDLQARDFRRAAVVALAEAGSTPQEISAITGHSLDETLEIMETYMPRTRKMAQNAIAAWERAGNRVGRESRTLENK